MMYSVVQRKIKNPRLEFKNGELFAIVPQGKLYLAEELVQKHQAWIARALLRHAELQKIFEELPLQKRSQAQLEKLITELIAQAAEILQVTPRSISYRLMKRRWGSCSITRDLVFNRRLAELPDELVWYVVFHEMCHLRVHSHNTAFKQLMAYQLGDLKPYKDKLKAYTQALYQRQ
jgi:predicted metal-dependent hydrolase